MRPMAREQEVARLGAGHSLLIPSTMGEEKANPFPGADVPEVAKAWPAGALAVQVFAEICER